MRTCPKCKQDFPDDLNYCLQDGTPLSSNPYSDSPTQVLSSIPTAETIRQSGTPRWPYIAIAALGLGFIAVAGVVFLPRLTGERADPAARETKIAAPVSNSKPAANAPAAASTTPLTNATVNNYASPSGQYKGDWISKMTSYGADVTITEVAGDIRGQIVWTLRSSPNPQKVNKIGTTAIEYVQGTYNPQTRMLDLKGFRKDDPNEIIILDNYHLSVADDNQTIIGNSINGKFILRRQ